MKKRFLFCFIMCLLLMTGFLLKTPEQETEAARLTLDQAKKLGLANSTKYSKLKSKVALKTVAKSSAIKALQLKIKHKTTLSWSPLLSFHLPEQLTLQEESEGKLKPLFLQNEIESIKHELNDVVFEIYEKVSNLYVEAYSLQETIKFQEEQLVVLNETYVKNKARLAINQATQKDVDSVGASIKKVEKSLAGNKRKFEKKKSKIKDLIGLDVTNGYTFSNPYVTAYIPRTQLNYFKEYTLANDHNFYKTRLTTAEALITLNTNYSLMAGHYGWKMNYISGYITAVKAGNKIDSNAFKKAFDTFVYKIDEPWYGKKRILFVKISREWFKGNIDGVRYVEDDPYVLYSNALDYQDAMADQEQAKVDLMAQVEDAYDNVITARNTYLDMEESVASMKRELSELLVLNSLGQATLEEYTNLQNQYDDLQLSLRSAYDMYTTLLFSFDRLTCGAVSTYLSGNDLKSDHSSGGTGYVIEQGEGTDVAKYYISPIISDNMFEFGVYIPDGYESTISDYELYVNGYRIGKKTPVSQAIRHMSFSLDDTPRAFVRLYDGDKMVCDCQIDADEYEGTLTVPGEFTVKDARKTIQIGTYTSETNDSDLLEIRFEFEKSEKISYYQITNKEGKILFKDEPMDANKSFIYLQLLYGSLDDLVIKCYDSDKKPLYDAYFNTSRNNIYKNNENYSG